MFLYQCIDTNLQRGYYKVHPATLVSTHPCTYAHRDKTQWVNDFLVSLVDAQRGPVVISSDTSTTTIATPNTMTLTNASHTHIQIQRYTDTLDPGKQGSWIWLLLLLPVVCWLVFRRFRSLLAVGSANGSEINLAGKHVLAYVLLLLSLLRLRLRHPLSLARLMWAKTRPSATPWPLFTHSRVPKTRNWPESKDHKKSLQWEE